MQNGKGYVKDYQQALTWFKRTGVYNMIHHARMFAYVAIAQLQNGKGYVKDYHFTTNDALMHFTTNDAFTTRDTSRKTNRPRQGLNVRVCLI